MPWVRLDEHFADHPKIVQAGPLGMALHVAALCYANRFLTDGFIPRAQVPRLVTLDDSEGVAKDLVQVGLWDEDPDGYRLHDYLDYQPSKTDVLAQREARSIAGRKGADSRWHGKDDGKPHGESMAEPIAKSCPGSVPVSVPVTETETDSPLVPSGPASLDKRRALSAEQQLAAKHLAPIQTTIASGKAFDLLHEFKDLWPKAWQEAIDNQLNPKAVGINLIGHFIAAVTGEEPDWARAGQLVGRYGRSALLGIDEGLMANADDPYRYANRVCQNHAAEQRAMEATP